ncbi:glycine betaine/L-proline ABC transporter ATP-binding protein [Breoghania sp. L-A4]|uniref:quaternary amine ABC transporter ATP-binding protein n=1 Tax=Breoghania sp. L-A4 TaxID=2304600 RepID=UPI000E35986A|nr:glycine betaine/L-proline ABC transporter ATP-binding protein [Breoghania sp. L-A4]AXS42307.1 glycine betaine/L-proline ABC transporter ATP-binding protein [Breoghania sp. L-A4]
MSLIEIKNVTKIFGSAPEKALPLVKAGMGKDELLAETGHTLGLHDVSLSIEQGEIFVIMGLSGSGKSTLIRHFNRLIDPTDGAIEVDGTDIMKFQTSELVAFRRHRMGMVFQRFGLLPHRTVIDNVAFGLEVQKVPKAERQETARKWIESVGLAGYEDQYPSQLSGGMQQRVGLARALATDGDILLMDEAFSALDPLIRSQMQDQLIELQEKLHKTIVFITHDLDEALRIGDRIAILKDGELIQVGTPPEILLNPADDYVRAFVRDVNRARVLTVDVVMKPPAHRITTDNLDRALDEMRRTGKDFGYYVADDIYHGVVTQEAVEQAIAGNDRAVTMSDIAVEAPHFGPEDTLENVLPASLESDYPIAVLGDKGELKGVVGHDEMSRALTPPPEDPAAKAMN